MTDYTMDQSVDIPWSYLWIHSLDSSGNMAEVEKQGNENFTEFSSNATARIPATTEGMAVAYGSLIIMALLPIFFGAFRSVKHHKEQKVTYT